jgi:Xaa-Pro aminopeptidase
MILAQYITISCQLGDCLQACKNEKELSGMREAHVRDGVALTKFLAWLEEAISKGEDSGAGWPITEYTAGSSHQPLNHDVLDGV